MLSNAVVAPAPRDKCAAAAAAMTPSDQEAFILFFRTEASIDADAPVASNLYNTILHATTYLP